MRNANSPAKLDRNARPENLTDLIRLSDCVLHFNFVNTLLFLPAGEWRPHDKRFSDGAQKIAENMIRPFADKLTVSTVTSSTYFLRMWPGLSVAKSGQIIWSLLQCLLQFMRKLTRFQIIIWRYFWLSASSDTSSEKTAKKIIRLCVAFD